MESQLELYDETGKYRMDFNKNCLSLRWRLEPPKPRSWKPCQ